MKGKKEKKTGCCNKRTMVPAIAQMQWHAKYIYHYSKFLDFLM